MENIDVIAIARELGKKLQQEDAYIKHSLARQAADEDKELQQLISRFSELRTQIAEDAAKQDEQNDVEGAKKRAEEMRKVYARIMTNEHMMAYNDTKDDFDIIMKRITAIIQKASEGEDPETADYSPECTGSCASCGGCG